MKKRESRTEQNLCTIISTISCEVDHLEWKKGKYTVSNTRESLPRKRVSAGVCKATNIYNSGDPGTFVEVAAIVADAMELKIFWHNSREPDSHPRAGNLNSLR